MRGIRSFLMLGAALAVSVLAACGSTTPSPGGTTCTPAVSTANLNLVLPGKLTDATDATYPPQEYVDAKTHQYTGMEIDLANEIAKRLCLTPNIQNVQFNTIIAGITTGSAGNQYYDLSISAFTITTDRQKQVDMIPYFQAGESMLVPTGNPKNIKSKTDLCGLAVGVESGTTEEAEIKSGDPTNPGLNDAGGACQNNPVKLISLPTEDQVIAQLLNGSVDVAYQDSPVSGYYAHLNPGKFQEITTVSPSPEGIVVRNDNSAFESAIKTVLAAMRADGTYLKILNTWGLSSGAFPACTAASCP